MKKIITDFLKHCKAFGKYSNNTIKNYNATYKQFINFAGNITEVTEQHIESFFTYLNEKNNGLAPSTINLKLAALDNLFDFAVRRNYFEDNPVEYIERKKVPHKEDIPLTVNEIDIMINNCNNTRNPIRNKAIIALLFASGGRISEIVKLDKSNINIADDCVLIHIQQAKEYKDRMVYIHPKYFNFLNEYTTTRCDEKKALFISERGNRISADTIRKMLKSVSDGIDKPVNPHAFRKAYASFLINQDVPMHIISDNLGHINEKVTDKNYAFYDHRKKITQTSAAFSKIN